jgi:hypothetical protein
MNQSDEMTVKIASNIIAATLTVIIIPLVILPFTLWDGFVLMKLWRWFLVPSLNAPVLAFGQTVGIAMTARFIVARRSSSGEKMTWQDCAFMVVIPAMVLLFGWIVKAWLM